MSLQVLDISQLHHPTAAPRLSRAVLLTVLLVVLQAVLLAVLLVLLPAEALHAAHHPPPDKAPLHPPNAAPPPSRPRPPQRPPTRKPPPSWPAPPQPAAASSARSPRAAAPTAT